MLDIVLNSRNNFKLDCDLRSIFLASYEICNSMYFIIVQNLINATCAHLKILRDLNTVISVV